MIERAVELAVLGWGMDVVDVSSPGGAAARLAAEQGATVWPAGLGELPAESMDRVLAVGPPVDAAEVMRVLRPGGAFVVACTDEISTRLEYEPWGVQLSFEPAGGRLLAIGRRRR